MKSMMHKTRHKGKKPQTHKTELDHRTVDTHKQCIYICIGITKGFVICVTF